MIETLPTKKGDTVYTVIPCKNSAAVFVPVKDIEIIIDYLWHDEQMNYREDKSGTHVFCSLKRVNRWLKSITKDKVK